MKLNKWVVQASCRAIHPLILAAVLFLVTGCSALGGPTEFPGVVVGTRDPNQILVVPDVDPDAIRNKTDEELLALAIEQGGVYFSVDQTTFEQVTLGTSVVVHWNTNDGEEASIPPRRNAHRVEILTE